MSFSASQHLRARLDSFLQNSFKVRRGGFVDDGADSCVLVNWITANVILSSLDESAREFRRNTLLYQNPLHCGAALTTVAIAAFGGQRDGELDLRVIQDDQWIISAEFEYELLVAGGRRNAFSNGHA